MIADEVGREPSEPASARDGCRRLLVKLDASRRTVAPTVLAFAALAPLPAIVTVLRGGDSFTGQMTFASVVAGSGLALCVDDPAAATLEASPTDLLRRRTLRAVPIAALLAAAWLATLALAGDRVGRPLVQVLAEMAAVAGIALAVAAPAGTDHPVAAGAGAATAGAGAALVVSVFSTRWPRVLPMLTGSQHNERWWWAGVAGALLAVLWSRRP